MVFNNNKPIYLQIVDRIMDSIVSGEYKAGERIPSVREYAADVEVNPNTAMRAYEWLQRYELIFNKRGIGYYVEDEALRRILIMRREKFFQEEAGYFFGRIASFGITPEELDDLYRAYLTIK